MTWETAATGQRVTYVALVEILLDTPVRVHSGLGVIAWGGEDWLGVGHLGAISEIAGGVDLEAADVQLTMSGILTDFRSELVNLAARGKRVNIYHGFLDESDASWTHEPELAYAGFVDSTELTDQAEDGRVSVALQINVLSAMAYVRRLTVYRRSHAHQQDLFAGDKFYSFKADLRDPIATPGGVVTHPGAGNTKSGGHHRASGGPRSQWVNSV